MSAGKRHAHMQLESMAAVLNDGPAFSLGGDALKRSKRRRATSHKRFCHYRRPAHAAAQHAPMGAQSGPEAADQQKQHPVPMNRRMRRKREEGWHGTRFAAGAGLLDVHADNAPASATGNAAVCVQAQHQAHRLPAHLWYVKRFVMRHQAGWMLAEHAHGKGGRRRSLRTALASRAVLHEDSHFVVIRVAGDAVEHVSRALTSVLRDGAEQGGAVPAQQVDAVLLAEGHLQLQCTLRGQTDVGPVTVSAAGADAEESDGPVAAVLRMHPAMEADAMAALQASSLLCPGAYPSLSLAFGAEHLVTSRPSSILALCQNAGDLVIASMVHSLVSTLAA